MADVIIGALILAAAVFAGQLVTGSRPALPVPPDYRSYLASPQWGRLRAQRLALDGHRCRGCGTGAALEVHHLTYERLGRELMADLVTACRACHQAVHARQRATGRPLAEVTAQVLRERAFSAWA